MPAQPRGTKAYADGLMTAFATERGALRAIYHDAADPRGAVLAVGGFDGGFSGPAHSLYADLGAALPADGIAVLRLDFRIKQSPGPIDEGTFDILAGIDWLVERDRRPIVLVGHSFGGAVAVRAGVRSPHVCGVVTLSTQTAGIEEVAQLAPRPILLLHGTADDRLPARGSTWVYAQAGEPKTLHLLNGATHSLRQQRTTLWSIVSRWILATIPERADSEHSG